MEGSRRIADGSVTVEGAREEVASVSISFSETGEGGTLEGCGPIMTKRSELFVRTRLE